MPSGPKKRRSQKKKKEAAAEREKTENEAPPTAISEENSPVMQTESTDGVTAVFDEPSVVLPKRTVLPEKMLAFEALDLKGKHTSEGINENALPTEISFSVPSQNIATPLAPCVIQLESKGIDGGKILLTDVCDFEGKETKGTIEYPVSSEIYSSVLLSEFHVATDVTENLKDDDGGGSVTASDDAAFSVMMDKAVKSLTSEPCGLDLNVADSNAGNAVCIDVDVAEDQRAMEHKKDDAVLKKQGIDLVVTANNRVAVENQDNYVLNEDDDAPGKTEASQGDEVEAAVQNKDAILEDFSEIEESAQEAAAENQVYAALNEVDAPEKAGKAVQVHEAEAAAENLEDALPENANKIKKSTLEALAEDQKTTAPNEVDAPGKTEVVPVDLVEAAIAAKPAVDYQTHETVSTELVPPEVGKQLKEIKEMVEDVLNRLNAVGALLHRN